mmetsp:Transcript_25887/g.41659  ORF Transcript_25887/g.41659 Transcript_25887/m.41659 type:complete len:284 (-) Transcript_25887:83-934(-)
MQEVSYSCQLMRKRRLVRVSVDIRTWKVKPEDIALESTAKKFALEGKSGSRKYQIRFSYPPGVCVRVSKDYKLSLKDGILTANLPVAKMPKKTVEGKRRGAMAELSKATGTSQFSKNGAVITKSKKKRKRLSEEAEKTQQSSVGKKKSTKNKKQKRKSGNERRQEKQPNSEKMHALKIMERVNGIRDLKVMKNMQRTNEKVENNKRKKENRKQRKKNTQKILQGVQEMLQRKNKRSSSFGEQSAADIVRSSLSEVSSERPAQQVKKEKRRHSKRASKKSVSFA